MRAPSHVLQPATAGLARCADPRNRRTRTRGSDEIAVAGGVSFPVRVLEPADREALATAFARLSEQARTQRFLAPKKELTDGDLARLCDVDHITSEALLAIDPTDESIVGVARYCASLASDDVAELAGAIIDGWEGHGIGRELLGRLIQRARANAIHTLTASAFSENAAALALLRRAGFTTTWSGHGVSELRLELTRKERGEVAELDRRAPSPGCAARLSEIRPRKQPK
jgi:RimJ/RimL family protein N-acetyltransferase